MILRAVFATSVLLISSSNAAINLALVGTWSSKSAKVMTGPGFYNPVNDSFIEPSHAGISYSFTADGFYESAYYRAVSNPTSPNCPKALLQFQHGTFTENANGSLSLNPIAVDGRQQLSDPCKNSKNSEYSRYHQPELMMKYEAKIDDYKKTNRLDLYQFDGTPIQPLYQAYSPPMMLPTVTMNPTDKADAAKETGAKVKRGEGLAESLLEPLNKDAKHIKRHVSGAMDVNSPSGMANSVWWAGVGMTLLGGAAYLL
ncbi:Reversal of tor2 lethality [Pseudogymnoascus destructans]|uniref:Protein ROT1 n=2 Tax=Pseudogymnoascus destructans TaxID=655981 RepID=L8G322_PSED2|nr:Reversal of tor2 lethality [Pseudogymnoascus destructans]ELR07532.1 hypothetical protein GMDG_02623 [Pseudogymnoascus destructans 20631-21]OAF61294.1 Reversal of tor2 lethality [Pseudogymnoascus destructans]